MCQFETSHEFIEGLIKLALQCLGVGATGYIFRTPEIDGEYLKSISTLKCTQRIRNNGKI